MIINTAEEVALTAFKYGNALLKYITSNDVGSTGSHQCGYHLPINAYHIYSPMHKPNDGINYEHAVSITWPCGRITDSRVKWYGKKTRHEYRLTRFGRNFEWLNEKYIGSLLALIAMDPKNYIAYIISDDDNIDNVQAMLDISISDNYATYISSSESPPKEDAEECITNYYSTYVEGLKDFPDTSSLTHYTVDTLKKCIDKFCSMSYDERLLLSIEREYQLYKLIERHVCHRGVYEGFKSVEDFIMVANSMLNKRKVRAGTSLENHIEIILNNENIPNKRNPSIEGRPDFIIPSEDAYNDVNYPRDKIIILASKRTCKDRWRQILREAPNVPTKYLLTLQGSISSAQLEQMYNQCVTLIVPSSIRKNYPQSFRKRILTVDSFIKQLNIEHFPI